MYTMSTKMLSTKFTKFNVCAKPTNILNLCDDIFEIVLDYATKKIKAKKNKLMKELNNYDFKMKYYDSDVEDLNCYMERKFYRSLFHTVTQIKVNFKQNVFELERRDVSYKLGNYLGNYEIKEDQQVYDYAQRLLPSFCAIPPPPTKRTSWFEDGHSNMEEFEGYFDGEMWMEDYFVDPELDTLPHEYVPLLDYAFIDDDFAFLYDSDDDEHFALMDCYRNFCEFCNGEPWWDACGGDVDPENIPNCTCRN